MFHDADALLLARFQFGFTVSFHFIFPAFSIGLASFPGKSVAAQGIESQPEGVTASADSKDGKGERGSVLISAAAAAGMRRSASARPNA